MSESKANIDHDVAQSVRELTAKVQKICNVLIPETPRESRARLKENDTVVKTLHEQRDNGAPEKILDWEKVDLLSEEDIQKENEQYAQKYEEIWKKIDESTPLEKETTSQAYTSAFTRFDEIYRLLSWRGNPADEGPLFDTAVLTANRNVLVESIFGIEVYQPFRLDELSERSRAVFEYSRLPRLLVILVRIACRQIYFIGACGSDISKSRPNPQTVVNVLALVARTLKGGHLAESVSLDQLLRKCYERRILVQPESSGLESVDTFEKQIELVYDCVGALNFTRRFREIREPLCALFYMRYKSDSIHQLHERIDAHENATVGIEPFPELGLTETAELSFQPEIFSVRYLQDFGRLKVEWTDCLDEHLKIYAHRNVIRVFAHPTVLYNFVDLRRDQHDYTHPTIYDLALTYALLFRPTSARNQHRLQKYTTAGEASQIRWHELVTFSGRKIHRFTPSWDRTLVGQIKPRDRMDINPLRSPTRNILSECFYRCSLPPAMQIAYNLANPSATVRAIGGSYDQHRLTSVSMQQGIPPPPHDIYPEDIKFMILSIMENGLTETESYTRHGYFAPRLRKIQSYLESRRPSSLRELWFDRRDYRTWWLFWGGGFLGSGILTVQVALGVMGVRSWGVSGVYTWIRGFWSRG